MFNPRHLPVPIYVVRYSGRQGLLGLFRLFDGTAANVQIVEAWGYISMRFREFKPR